jgi:hypothetical protein
MRATRVLLVLVSLVACSDSKRPAADDRDASDSDELDAASETDDAAEPAQDRPLDAGGSDADAPRDGGAASDAAVISAPSDAGRLPPGPAVQVTAEGADALQFDGSDVCVIDALGDIRCRNLSPVWKLYRKGPFKAMALVYLRGCGIAPNDSVSCWSGGSSSPGLCPGAVSSCVGGGEPPAEKFAQISIYDKTACGVTMDGRLLCWGENDDNRATPPGGNDFTSVKLDSELSCGLRRDGSAACWAPYNTNGVTMIAGQGKQLAIHTNTVCILRNDGTVSCSGFYGGDLTRDPLAKDLAQISVGTNTVCGLTQAGAARCFAAGQNDTFKRVLPPVGPFKAIINTSQYACGLRGDNQVECWGEFWGNGAGSETCLLNQQRLSIDGQSNIIDTPSGYKDDRLSSDAGLRSSTSTNQGFVLVESASARASNLWAVGADAGTVPLRSGLFMLAGSDTATGDIYCAGPNASGSVERHDDELLLDFSSVALLGQCPGSEPVEGSFSACFGSSSCTSSALTGSLRGESKNIALRSEAGGNIGRKLGYADGSILITRKKDEQPVWGLFVLPPDASGQSEVLCAGGLSKSGNVTTFSKLTTLGRCKGPGTHTLTGCLR